MVWIVTVDSLDNFPFFHLQLRCLIHMIQNSNDTHTHTHTPWHTESILLHVGSHSVVLFFFWLTNGYILYSYHVNSSNRYINANAKACILNSSKRLSQQTKHIVTISLYSCLAQSTRGLRIALFLLFFAFLQFFCAISP